MKRLPRKKKKAMKKEVIRCMNDQEYFVKKYLDLPNRQKKVLIERLNHIVEPLPRSFHELAEREDKKAEERTMEFLNQCFALAEKHNPGIIERTFPMSGQEKRRNRRKKKI